MCFRIYFELAVVSKRLIVLQFFYVVCLSIVKILCALLLRVVRDTQDNISFINSFILEKVFLYNFLATVINATENKRK